MNRALGRAAGVGAAILVLLAFKAVRLSAQDEPAAATPAPVRAGWYTDQRPVGVGDLLTIRVDERTTANERTGRSSTSTRQQQNSVAASVLSEGFASATDSRSREDGSANRAGDLSTVMTVRVTGFEANGVLQVEGTRVVRIDGRAQRLVLRGLIRPQDVGNDNMVSSSRLADATIEYQGRRIGPSAGIFGRLIGLIWP